MYFANPSSSGKLLQIFHSLFIHFSWSQCNLNNVSLNQSPLMTMIIIKSDFHGNAEILSSHFPKRSLALFRKFAAVAQCTALFEFLWPTGRGEKTNRKSGEEVMKNFDGQHQGGWGKFYRSETSQPPSPFIDLTTFADHILQILKTSWALSEPKNCKYRKPFYISNVTDHERPVYLGKDCFFEVSKPKRNSGRGGGGGNNVPKPISI